MTKQEIIGLVEELVEKRTAKEAYVEEAVGNKNDKNDKDGKNPNKGVGTNQMRRLASLCSKAECCEEIEMLVAYKMAKAKQGESWNFVGTGKESPGNAVLAVIRRIRETDGTEQERLNSLRLFFGYMYWKARIWSNEVKMEGGARR